MQVVCSSKDSIHYRLEGRNQYVGSGKSVSYPSAIASNDMVYVRTLPLGPSSRSLTFRLKTFFRRFRPTGSFYQGDWS